MHYAKARLAKWGKGDGDWGTYDGDIYEDQSWKLVPRFNANVSNVTIWRCDNRQGSESAPLFVANVIKLGPAKRWKQNAVVNQKFMMTLDQQRSPKGSEDLNIAANHAIADATDELIEELKIPEDYWMTVQIGSKEHRRDGLTGETWKIPVGDFTQRAAMTQALLTKLSLVLNSSEFITNDVGFSASVLFSRPSEKVVNEQAQVQVR